MPSHGECREKCCILCLSKATASFTDSLKNLIIKHARPNLAVLLEDIRMPTGLCQLCRLTLQQLEKEGKSKSPLRLFEVDKLLISKRRSDSSFDLVKEDSTTCTCLVCRIAKSRGTLSKDLADEIAKVKRGRPKTAEEKGEICPKCLTEKRRGRPHPCNNSAMLQNLDKRLPQKSKEQFTSHQLKKLAESSNSSAGGPSTVMVSTGGPKLPVTVGNIEKAKKNLQFSHTDMNRIQSDLNLSDNQAEKLARDMRVVGGRDIIQPNLRGATAQVHRSLDTFFDIKTVSFEISKNEETKMYDREERTSVVCNDTPGLIKHLISERGLNPAITLTKFTLDGGKGMFKVCMNLIEDHLVLESPIKKRSRYSDGLEPGRAKPGGVLQSLIIGLFPQIPETYNNLKTIYDLLDLNKVEHVVSGDFKVLNILAGLQPCSSKHPCVYCTWEADKDVSQVCPLRSLGSIREKNMLWESWSQEQRLRGREPDRGKLKDFDNCEHRPVFSDCDDTLLLDKCPPPQLHIFLGVTNLLVKHLIQTWPTANEWPERLCLEREAQFGGTYNGNSCKKLLNNLAVLRDLKPPRYVKHYLNILDTLKSIVSGCFGSKLSQTYLQDIEQFRHEFELLRDEKGQLLKKTPKVQHLIIHVPQFCQKNGIGLGVFSEQVVESMHSAFDKVWKNYEVPLKHEHFGKRLFRASMKLNTSHV